MKQVEYFFWRVPQEPPKRPYITRWRMSIEDGRKRFPTGEPVLASREVRDIAETYDEIMARAHVIRPNAPKY